jgi:hypothetical protein
MLTKQLLLATALAAVVAATGALAAPDDQHHRQQAATPDQQGAEGTPPAMPGCDAGAAPQTGGADMGMMAPGMMGGGRPMIMHTPAPGVTIIINMQGTPMVQGPMMGGGETAQGPARRPTRRQRRGCTAAWR